MYAYIQGTVVEQEKNYIVVENNNIGFKITTPNPFVFSLGDMVKIFTYQHVREDLIELFGFKAKDEKELFLRLISVKGIGPKGALAILATGSVDGIVAAIETGNSEYLRKFPGIGPKASQQIVLDLKGKLDQSNLAPSTKEVIDVKEVLLSLGYNAREINKILPKLEIGKIDDMVKQALQMLLK